MVLTKEVDDERETECGGTTLTKAVAGGTLCRREREERRQNRMDSGTERARVGSRSTETGLTMIYI